MSNISKEQDTTRNVTEASKEQRAVEIISQVSTGQRVHDIALILLEKYLSSNNISVECDVTDVKAHIKTYETFHNWVLNYLDL